ncbi:hypothetical protein ACS0TY_029423 [Phlomoides rotata]
MEDARRIIKTHISPVGFQDDLIWHFDLKGVFTVKSAYTLAEGLVHDQSLVTNVGWGKLWKLSVPPKVKVCIWKICRGYTPSKSELFRRHILMERMCGCCNMEIESAWHIFMNYTFAKEVWQLSLVHEKVEELAFIADSLEDFVLQGLSNLEGDDVIEFVMAVWELWECRNDRVFNNRLCSAATALRLARSFLLDWHASRCCTKRLGVVVQQQPVSCRAWHPVGKLKLNIDTAFFEDSAEMGFGMVIRDSNGVHFLSRTMAMPALSWIKELDIRDVEIEMDTQVVVNVFNSRVSSFISVFGDIIQACKNVFNSYPHCKVGWINRQTNELAHNFARIARDFSSPFVWAELPATVECRPFTSCTC